jgi:hypothetical protein
VVGLFRRRTLAGNNRSRARRRTWRYGKARYESKSMEVAFRQLGFNRRFVALSVRRQRTNSFFDTPLFFLLGDTLPLPSCCCFLFITFTTPRRSLAPTGNKKSPPPSSFFKNPASPACINPNEFRAKLVSVETCRRATFPYPPKNMLPMTTHPAHSLVGVIDFGRKLCC